MRIIGPSVFFYLYEILTQRCKNIECILRLKCFSSHKFGVFLAENVTVEALITETFENSLHFIVALIFAEK
jgi:hypothetical protein